MKKHRLMILATLALLIPTFAISATLDATNFIIENIRLVQDDNEQAVSLVITDGKLEMVTTDLATVDRIHQVVDAQGGYLMGNLEIDSPPNIIIVREDPTENFDMFWEIQANAIFALRDGEILKNHLAIKADRRVVTGPPVLNLDYGTIPTALPLRYWNAKPFNHWQTENSTGLFSAMIALDRQRWISQNGASRTQVGDLEDFDGGIVRAFQFGVIGSLNHFDRPWSYMIFAASNEFDRGFNVEESDELTFVDYWLDIPTGDNSNLIIGKHKEPMSMERTISLTAVPVQERATAVDAFLPSRNFGVSLSGASTDRSVTWRAGLYNNFIDSDDSLADSSSELVGRSTWVPWSTDNDDKLIHLGLGLRYSTAKQGVRYRAGSELSESPTFVDTGLINAESTLTSDLELGLKRGPLWLQAELLNTSVEAATGDDLYFRGHHLTASLVITGETRGYNHRYGNFTLFPVSRSVDHGGWGAIELAARWSHLDLDDGAVRGGEVDVFSVGANWWLKPTVYLTLAIRRSKTETLEGDGWTTGLLTRLAIIVR